MSNPFFPITSRYNAVDTAKLQTRGGEVVYLLRRFVPQPYRFQLLQLHTVTQGERLDNITAKYFVDPEQFWRIADANGAMRPAELTETIGRKIRITLPEGIPGPSNA
jgi:hypothetical protein